MLNIAIKIINIWEIFKKQLHSLNDPANISVRIDEFDPMAVDIVKKIKKNIEHISPNLLIHLIGSVSLGISGRKDIDLFVECPMENLKKFGEVFTKSFGKPHRIKNNYVEWKFDDSGWEIDIVLIDPKTEKFKDQMLSFMILKNKPELRIEYEKLKKNFNGSSIRKYEKAKRTFFSQLIKEHSR